MSGLAAVERAALAETLAAADPGAPTLCAGWTVADLGAHLVVRDHRPDSAPGAVVAHGPLARWTEHVRVTARDAAPYPDLVERVRGGPPLARVPPLDDAVNTAELFVDHEDVRRAGTSPARPRRLDDERQQALWSRLKPVARLLCRPGRGRAVVLTDGWDRRLQVGRGTDVTTVTGEPLELLLWVFGRRDAAEVRVGR